MSGLARIREIRDHDHQLLRESGRGELVDMAERVEHDSGVTVHVSDDGVGGAGAVRVRAIMYVEGMRISYRNIYRPGFEHLELELRRIVANTQRDAAAAEESLRRRRSLRGSGGVL
jgi:hypothetical protein